MKRLIVLVLLFLFSCAGETSKLEKRDGIYFLKLEGSHYEIGYQHATEFRNGVLYVGRFFRRILPDEFLNLLKESGFIKRLEDNFPEELRDEARGMADGLNGELFNYEALIIASYGYYFVDNFFYNQQLPMCSGFVAFGPATTDGILINARNMDWMQMDILLRYPTVILYRPEGKNAFISIGYPSMIGVISGMNEKGIAVSLLASPSTDCTWDGTDITLILRLVMENADTIDEAEEMITSARIASGCNILLSSGFEKTGSVVEVSASRSAIRKPENSVLLVANHYLSENMKETQTGWEGELEWSLYRFSALQKLLEENYGKIDFDVARRIMETYPVGNTFTVHQIIYIPEKLKLLVKMKGAAEKYVEFKIK
jgi:predicted choloylglycine hydrolase